MPESTDVLTFNFDELWDRLVAPWRKSLLDNTRYHAGDRDRFGRDEVSQRLAVRRFRAAFDSEPAAVLPVSDGFFVACA